MGLHPKTTFSYELWHTHLVYRHSNDSSNREIQCGQVHQIAQDPGPLAGPEYSKPCHTLGSKLKYCQTAKDSHTNLNMSHHSSARSYIERIMI